MPASSAADGTIRARRPPWATLALLAAAVTAASPEAQQPLGAPPPVVAGARPAPGDRIFQTTAVHRLHITVAPDEWAILQTSTPRGGAAGGTRGGSDYRDSSGRLIHVGSGFGGYFPWVRADVRIEHGGERLEFRDVGLRYKGNLSFQSSSASAPLFANFKLKLDVHGARGRWDGLRTFNLHAGVVDTSKMREAIAYAVFRAAGVPAPRTAYAELVFTVPGRFASTAAGLFVLVEDVNNTFLERVLPPGNGLLMKPEGMRGGIQSVGATWDAFTPTYRPDRDATPHEQDRVMAFARLVSQPDVATFRARISDFLDVDEFLRFVAVHALIVNNDSYLRGGHNFYLYLDPRDDRFRFIPWDQDLSLGTRGNQTVDLLRPFTGDQPLLYWLLDDPAVNARYREILRDLATTVFTPAALSTLVEALEQTGAGRYGSPRGFLESRAAYVQQVIAAWGRKD